MQQIYRIYRNSWKLQNLYKLSNTVGDEVCKLESESYHRIITFIRIIRNSDDLVIVIFFCLSYWTRFFMFMDTIGYIKYEILKIQRIQE